MSSTTSTVDDGIVQWAMFDRRAITSLIIIRGRWSNNNNIISVLSNAYYRTTTSHDAMNVWLPRTRVLVRTRPHAHWWHCWRSTLVGRRPCSPRRRVRRSVDPLVSSSHVHAQTIGKIYSIFWYLKYIWIFKYILIYFTLILGYKIYLTTSVI